MAIYHFSTKSVSRSSGRSAVAAAAYRAGVRLVDDRTGNIHDYRRRRGVVHSEIILPAGSIAKWALNREKLWNTAEKSENRKDSKTASEIVIGLPKELNAGLQKKLTMRLAQHVADKYGVAVDVAIHAPTSSLKNGSEEEEYHPPNYHAHLLFTTREVKEHGLSEQKTIFEKENTWLRKNNLPTGPEQVKELRKIWELLANEELALDGHDVRIDCRSHAERGLHIKPTKHVGVHATAMIRQGKKVHRKRLSEEDKIYNEKLIIDQPNEILRLITSEQSVFDRYGVARAVHRYVDDKDFQSVFAAVMSSKEIFQLQPDTLDKNGRRVPAKLTTRGMVEVENQIIRHCKTLSQRKHKVSTWKLRRAIAAENKVLESKIGAKLTEEQQIAVRHLTGSEKISAVVGLAGAGKSTMLSAARAAWEAQGYEVLGAAIAGKAADGLQQLSGIRSRTLASFELGWKHGYGLLQKDQVLVVDESGLIDSRQLARVISEVERRGAKLVLVGDPDQLQPLGAGSGFRAVVDQIGAAELTEIRRQKTRWQCRASVHFASGQVEKALKAYDTHNAIKYADTRTDTILSVAADYLADMAKKPNETRLAITYRRKDVQALNASIRKGSQLAGRLKGETEYMHQTATGLKAFARGDRVILEANDRNLNVKNGMLGTIVAVDKKSMKIRLDDADREVLIPMKKYQAVNYGYAITVHKSQGITVDRSYVMATKTFDRHIGYVSMTRHRESAKLYCNRQDYQDLNELTKKLSMNKTSENPMDYLEAFSDRRDLGGGVVEDIGPVPKWRPNSNPLSKRDQAIDFFAVALEDMVWERRMRGETSLDLHRHIWSEKMFNAFEMLDREEQGLSGMIRDIVSKGGEQFILEVLDREEQGLSGMIRDIVSKGGEQFILEVLDRSGQSRVDFIDGAVDYEKMRRKTEQVKQGYGYDHEEKPRKKWEHEHRKSGYDYNYKPGF